MRCTPTTPAAWPREDTLRVRAGIETRWDPDTGRTLTRIRHRGRVVYEVDRDADPDTARAIVDYYLVRYAVIDVIRTRAARRDPARAAAMLAGHTASHVPMPRGLLAELRTWAATVALGVRGVRGVARRLAGRTSRGRSPRSRRTQATGRDDGDGPGDADPEPPRGHDGGRWRSREVERRRGSEPPERWFAPDRRIEGFRTIGETPAGAALAELRERMAGGSR